MEEGGGYLKEMGRSKIHIYLENKKNTRKDLKFNLRWNSEYSHSFLLYVASSYFVFAYTSKIHYDK